MKRNKFLLALSAAAYLATLVGLAPWDAAQAQTSVPSYTESATGNVKAGIGVTVLSGGSGGGAVYGPDAQGAASTQPPVQDGCIYNSTLPTVTNAQVVRVQCSPKGTVLSTLYDNSGGPIATQNNSVDAMGNTSSVAVTGFGYLYNGATWDRLRSGGTTGSASVSGGVASGAADGGNPVKVGGVYNSTLPTFTNGQRGDLQIGAKGLLRMAVGDDAGNLLAIQPTGVGDAAGSITTMPVYSQNRIYNGTGAAWDRMYTVANGQNTTGTGIQATGPLCQVDDTATGGVTENQWGPIRCTTAARAQFVVNQQTARPSSNFTFSASTPTYAAGQLVANSATAGSVTPLSWTIVTSAACSADIYSASLSITQTGTGLNTGMDGWQLLLHLTTATPTFGAGDGVAYRITTGGASEVAVFSCTLTQYDDAATGMCVPQAGAVPLKLASGLTLSGYLVAQGAPVGGARQASKVVTATLFEKMDFC